MFTVIQELGREGVLPYASFFASNRPFNAPLAGLFTQYIVSCIFMLAPPPGDAYLFMISRKFSHVFCSCSCPSDAWLTVSSYSLALINTLVSAGLLLLYTKAYQEWDWDPPFRAPKLIVWLFFLSNIFLVVIPLIPPVPGSKVYDYLPYWVSGIINLTAYPQMTGSTWLSAACFRGVSSFTDWGSILVHMVHLVA